jgi:signal transduction histidine kinase
MGTLLPSVPDVGAPLPPSAPGAGAAPAVPPEKLQAVTEILRAIGYTLSNAAVYGPAHNVTRRAIATAVAATRAFHGQYGNLQVDLNDEGFFVENAKLAERSANVEALRKRLTALGAHGLGFLPGFSEDEMERLAGALSARREGSAAGQTFADLIQAASLPHVSAATYTYRRVFDDQDVVAKQKDAAGPAGLSREMTDRIAQFLSDPEGAGENPLQELNAEQEALGETLRDVLAPSGSAPAQAVDGCAAKAVEAIRRIGDGLSANRANRTQKGRRAVKRLLGLLGEAVQDRLRGLGDDGSAAARVTACVQEVSEDIEIDGLAAKYARQVAGADASERRILRQMKRMAGDAEELAALRERLSSSGLPAAVWLSLLARCGVTAEPGADAPSLDALMDRLRAFLAQPADGAAAAAPRTEGLLAEVGQRVAGVLATSEARLRTLSRDAPPTVRVKMLAWLAELGQELRQPLTAIQGSVDAVLAQHLGPINERQAGLLRLASESGGQLNALIDRMVELAGVPETLAPDGAIIDDLYGRS